MALSKRVTDEALKFIETLPQEGWRLTEDGEIRYGDSCPISKAASCLLEDAGEQEIAERLGLSQHAVTILLLASDDLTGVPESNIVRKAMFDYFLFG